MLGETQMLEMTFFADSNSVMYLDRNLRLVLHDVETNTIQVLLTTEQVVNHISIKKKWLDLFIKFSYLDT